MQTRRQLLQQALLVPLITGSRDASPPAPLEIICEPDCLSQESARGFALLSPPATRVIVVCGAGATARARAPELFRRARNGAWIVWENSPSADPSATLQHVFGISIKPPSKTGLYVRYVWPHSVLTRSFVTAVPVPFSASEIIADCAGIPVAVKRRIGRGGIVFLGSMLGPNLYAGEPEARQIAEALLCI